MTDELRDLCSAAVDGVLTPEQARRLEDLVLADPAARRFVVEHLNLHASLAWAAGDPAVLAGESPAERMAPRPAETRREDERNKPARSPGRGRWVGWALAACLLVGVGVSLFAVARGPREFAQLVDAHGCKWESGTLPTADGSRLGAGRLRLAEGVARIVFDNGAELRLEGPADLELHAGDRCVLHTGRLVARCPDAARGFVVETPAAKLTDYGTEFGVSVADGKADVQVFEGRVDATHRGTGRVEQLLTGRGMRFTPDVANDLGPLAEGPRGAEQAPAVGPGQRLVTVSTATGRGKDTYVSGKPALPNRSDMLLLVKACAADKPDYHRKSYVGFDLAAVGGRVEGAQLSFTQAPTGMGFASEVPDSTFTVYGLTDPALDAWPDTGLSWETAPANAPGGAAVDPAKTVKVGEFRLAQGVQTGVCSVGGPALAEFLNTRKNGYATFIVVRETPGSGRNDYVHGFAGRDHPTLPPPTLKLVVEGK